MHRSPQDTSLHHRPLAKLESMVRKAQDFICTLCGHRWLGVSGTCPSCQGIAKSEGEVTKKTLQGEDNDLKKGLR
jgi:rubrerythrin